MTSARDHLKTIVILGSLVALFVGVGNVVAPGYLGVFAMLGFGMSLGVRFFSDRLAGAVTIGMS